MARKRIHRVVRAPNPARAPAFVCMRLFTTSRGYPSTVPTSPAKAPEATSSGLSIPLARGVDCHRARKVLCSGGSDRPHRPTTSRVRARSRAIVKDARAMPPKKPLVDQSVLANLKVLQKDDPDVEEILGSASHVTLYGFDLDAKAWVRARAATATTTRPFLFPRDRTGTSARERSTDSFPSSARVFAHHRPPPHTHTHLARRRAEPQERGGDAVRRPTTRRAVVPVRRPQPTEHGKLPRKPPRRVRVRALSAVPAVQERERGERDMVLPPGGVRRHERAVRSDHDRVRERARGRLERRRHGGDAAPAGHRRRARGGGGARARARAER
eukprot:31302-Pelagococcus_subviridis.AAC.1